MLIIDSQIKMITTVNFLNLKVKTNNRSECLVFVAIKKRQESKGEARGVWNNLC